MELCFFNDELSSIEDNVMSSVSFKTDQVTQENCLGLNKIGEGLSPMNPPPLSYTSAVM